MAKKWHFLQMARQLNFSPLLVVIFWWLLVLIQYFFFFWNKKRTNISYYFIFPNFSNGFDITYSKRVIILFHNLMCLNFLQSFLYFTSLFFSPFENFTFSCKLKMKTKITYWFAGDKASLQRNASIHCKTIGSTAYDCGQFFYERQKETSWQVA